MSELMAGDRVRIKPPNLGIFRGVPKKGNRAHYVGTVLEVLEDGIIRVKSDAGVIGLVWPEEYTLVQPKRKRNS